MFRGDLLLKFELAYIFVCEVLVLNKAKIHFHSLNVSVQQHFLRGRACSLGEMTRRDMVVSIGIGTPI